MELHGCADNPLQEGIMQFASDSCALADSLFQAKFSDPSRYRPAKKGGDEKRGDGCRRHDKDDPALDISHVQDGSRQLFANLLVNTLNQCRSLSLQWFQFVGQPKFHGPPIARSGQRGDGFELGRQSNLNRFQSRQKCWVYRDLRRQVSQDSPCSPSLFQESSAQYLGFGRKQARILGLYKLIQPLMKCQEALLKPQNHNQLLANGGESICLEASYMKLPN